MAKTDPKPRFSGEWWKRKAVEATAVGVAALTLVGCAPGTSAEKPPAASPAVPGETPAPSEGNPVETPDNGEKDPLSPENLWAMGEKELLAAVRIPEGTPPEEWVQLYAKYKQALFNAASNQEEYEKWLSGAIKNGDNTAISVYAKHVFNKFVPAFEQLEGSTLNRTGPTMDRFYHAVMMNYMRSRITWGSNVPAIAVAPHIVVTGKIVSSDEGNITFNESSYLELPIGYEEFAYDNFPELRDKFMPNDATSVVSKDPVTYIAKDWGYNKKAQTMQPAGGVVKDTKTV